MYPGFRAVSDFPVACSRRSTQHFLLSRHRVFSGVPAVCFRESLLRVLGIPFNMSSQAILQLFRVSTTFPRGALRIF